MQNALSREVAKKQSQRSKSSSYLWNVEIMQISFFRVKPLEFLNQASFVFDEILLWANIFAAGPLHYRACRSSGVGTVEQNALESGKNHAE